MDRLTDTSRYGGTHRERFDGSGKGRGKVVLEVMKPFLSLFSFRKEELIKSLMDMCRDIKERRRLTQR